MKILEALGIDIKILIAQLVNFAILLFVLYKFGYKHIFNFLENRKKQIEKGIKDAHEAENKLVEMGKKEEEILTNAKKESQRLIVVAEEFAKKNKEGILEEAKQEADKVMSSAHKKIEEERQQILKETKNEVAGLVVSTTEKILGEKMNSEKDVKLIEKAIQ